MAQHPKFVQEKVELALEEKSYCKLCGKNVHPSKLTDYCCAACNSRLDSRWYYNNA